MPRTLPVVAASVLAWLLPVLVTPANAAFPSGAVGGAEESLGSRGDLETGTGAPVLFGTDLLAQRVLDDDEERPKPKRTQEPETLSPKSPWLAMALSAAVPGAGQFYVKPGNLLSFGFAGVEALSWYLHVAWDGDGDEKVDEYERYAWTGALDPDVEPVDDDNLDILRDEGNWSWVRWRAVWRGEDPGCQLPPEHDYPEVDARLNSFWFNNRHEFYEDIGKYDKYRCGWRSPESREIYLDMRREANDLYDKSRSMSQVILLNHVVSSIHAFFVAKGHNRRILGTSSDLRWDVLPDSSGGLRAQLALSRRF